LPFIYGSLLWLKFSRAGAEPRFLLQPRFSNVRMV
jgi:hypothetical protein